MGRRRARLADMGFDRKAAEKAVLAAAESAGAAAGPATLGESSASGEREREIFRAALLDLSAGS